MTAHRRRVDRPTTMRAAVVDRFGRASAIAIREVPVRPLRARDVLIRIDTAGVGEWDAKMRKGDVRTEHGFPLVMGTDGSGTVADVGRGVTRVRRGDRVWS